MNYKLRRRLYSQNFLCNPKLVAKLIRNSSIGKKDIVLEIGPGKGFITSKLIETAGRVSAIELDRKLCLHLNLKFQGVRNLEVINKNFLNHSLPVKPFKVFSNIPFSITADVVRKLTANPNFCEGYLIVQKEAAVRFIGKPLDFKNSMLSTLLKPWFDISVFWEFSRWDFIPRPNVDIVMIKIKRKENPEVSSENKLIYKDYVLYSYNSLKVAKMDYLKFLKSFETYLKQSDKRTRLFINKKVQKIITDGNSIAKINRTRNYFGWKEYGKLGK